MNLQLLQLKRDFDSLLNFFFRKIDGLRNSALKKYDNIIIIINFEIFYQKTKEMCQEELVEYVVKGSQKTLKLLPEN